jgi:hypothetical protein
VSWRFTKIQGEGRGAKVGIQFLLRGKKEVTIRMTYKLQLSTISEVLELPAFIIYTFL